MGSGVKVSHLEGPVIFFDGVCNLCNGAIQFVIKHDKKEIFKFAPLQSNYAKLYLEQKHQILDTIVLIQNNGVYTKSDAAIRIAKQLRFPFSLLHITRIIPRFLRDAVYEFIAKNRYKWFGKSTECMVPSAALLDRFLS